MQRTDVVIIGAGQAGLAMSACLTARKIDHVVLERGHVGERWRSATWDSLRLLTPNWLNRLPGWRYAGADPHGYMSRHEFIAYLGDYAAAFRAPVITGADVRLVAPCDADYRVDTARGTWRAAAIVIATGQCEQPFVPAMAQKLSPAVYQLPAARYRCPDALPDAGVLIVGASASGVQIAEEIRHTGRPVTLAVGQHSRLLRHYRGRDIMAWLDCLGILNDRPADIPDLGNARRQPSLQLVGRPQPALDLRALREIGVRVTGRALAAGRTTMEFAGDLAATTEAAEQRLARMLARVDRLIAERGLDADDPEPRDPLRLDEPPARIDLAQAGIATVIWATGYQPRYPWLALPVLENGEVAEQGGITAAPGVFILGLRWLRRRSSSFIEGTGRDATELAVHVADHVARRARRAA